MGDNYTASIFPAEVYQLGCVGYPVGNDL